jgi:hypothetical protein
MRLGLEIYFFAFLITVTCFSENNNNNNNVGLSCIWLKSSSIFLELKIS